MGRRIFPIANAGTRSEFGNWQIERRSRSALHQTRGGPTFWDAGEVETKMGACDV